MSRVYESWLVGQLAELRSRTGAEPVGAGAPGGAVATVFAGALAQAVLAVPPVSAARVVEALHATRLEAVPESRVRRGAVARVRARHRFGLHVTADDEHAHHSERGRESYQGEPPELHHALSEKARRRWSSRDRMTSGHPKAGRDDQRRASPSKARQGGPRKNENDTAPVGKADRCALHAPKSRPPSGRT